jgi:FkbH-like protein
MLSEKVLETVSRGSTIQKRPLTMRDIALSNWLTDRRHTLAEALLGGVADWEKYAGFLATDAGRQRFLEQEVYAFVDYLAIYFRTGDETYRHLYVGEKLKQIYHHGDDRAQKLERGRALLDFDRRTILDCLRPLISAAQQSRLEVSFDEIERVILNDASSQIDVLLVGDCLYLDMQAFLPAQCLEDGIGVNFTFATSKNGATLRKHLQSLSSQKFDLVFYSPFTYEFSPLLEPFFQTGLAFASASRIRPVVDQAMADAEATLNILAAQFECPVLVHNTLSIFRHDGSFRERIRELVTCRTRRKVRSMLNRRVSAALAERNAAFHEHLFLIDETTLLERHSERELGRKLYDSEMQHPVVMGMALANEYRDLIAAHVNLAGRKLIVCDLDNTLWDGLIGEGVVSHFLDRQRTLRALKGKGIVLAVNSKNDPQRVHWSGALLNGSDFVDLEINWDSKITNMKRIREALNLKFKDYVFIDDRADQLELVGSVMPEIRLLDATDARSWRLLDAWSRMLPVQNEGDRTQQYHERRARESFVSEIGEEDQAALFKSLEICVTLRETERADLQRVTELINRTNQFNLAGSRTTFGEVARWHEDRNYHLLIAEAADKFGKMGLISVAIVAEKSAVLDVPMFVLSCRVFGYGIETVMLNAIKRLAIQADGSRLPIRGAYQETPHNAPCKSMYPDHGFTWDGDAWIYEASEISAEPEWLTIEDRVTIDRA